MMSLMTLKQELHAGCLGSGKLYTVPWETFAQDYFRPCIYIYHFSCSVKFARDNFQYPFCFIVKTSAKVGVFFRLHGERAKWAKGKQGQTFPHIQYSKHATE